MDRLDQANKLYDEGKFDEAYALLGIKELDARLHDALRLSADDRILEINDILEAHMLAIAILEKKDDSGVFDREIEKRYRTICKLVEKYHFYEDALFDYIEFLKKTDQKDTALDVCDIIEKVLMDDSGHMEIVTQQLVRVYNIKGELLKPDNLFAAGKCFKLALFIYENELTAKGREEIMEEVSLLYQNIGEYYFQEKEDNLAKKYFKQHLAFVDKIYDKTDEVDASRILIAYGNVINCCYDMQEDKMAKELYQKAVAIGEMNADSEIVELSVMGVYLTICKIAQDERDGDTLLELGQKGVTLFEKLLAKKKESVVLEKNTATFSHFMGDGHAFKKEYDEAEKCYRKTEKIYSKLEKIDTNLTDRDSIILYEALFEVYEAKKDYVKAEKYLLSINEKCEKYLKKDHWFGLQLVANQFHLAQFYYKKKDYEKAKPYYLDIVETVVGKESDFGFPKDVMKKMKQYTLELADICENLGQTDEAKKWKEVAKTI